MKKVAYPALILVIIASAFLAGSLYDHRTLASAHSGGGRKILYYVDPMHPSYKSDKPGVAPDCGMALDAVYADERAEEKPAVAPAGAVNISAEKQQRIGLRVAEAQQTSGASTLRLFGRVAPEETKVYKLVAGMDGVTRAISGVTTGSHVKKDQWLATFSAPELRNPIQGYIIALDVNDRQRKGGVTDPAMLRAGEEGAQQARDRALNFGITPQQLDEILKTRETPIDLKIQSPVDGFVLARNLSQGQRFDKNAEWFRIADLSRVWIVADVFEKDAKTVRPGQTARVSLAGDSRIWNAKVTDVPPAFDPSSRTLKVRLEVDNPDFALRPDMFVDVQLAVALPAGVTVPADAVLDSGLKKTVFVDLGDGSFEPREVETGWRFDDRVEIVRGVNAGERVVTAANFLLDSETRLRQPAAAPRTDMAAGKDPVCGMDLKGAKSQFNAEYHGEQFHFCSDHCRTKFEHSPSTYTNHNASGHQSTSGARS